MGSNAENSVYGRDAGLAIYLAGPAEDMCQEMSIPSRWAANAECVI